VRDAALVYSWTRDRDMESDDSNTDPSPKSPFPHRSSSRHGPGLDLKHQGRIRNCVVLRPIHAGNDADGDRSQVLDEPDSQDLGWGL